MDQRRFFSLMAAALVGACVNAEKIGLADGRELEGDVVIKGSVVTVSSGKKLFQFGRESVKTLNGQPLTAEAEKELAAKAAARAEAEAKARAEAAAKARAALKAKAEAAAKVAGEEKLMAAAGEAAKPKAGTKGMQNPIIKFVTSKGDITAQLFEDKVPNTVANIITLAESGFYKGMTFHRIIDGFMAQGGCPYSKPGAPGMAGTGGPGYKIKDEFDASLKHVGPGILSMANAGPNTGGSQFFLCFKSTPWLDGKHAVFGKVTDGLDVLKKLEKVGTRSGKPTEQVTFNIEVVRKNDHPYKVKKR